MIVIKKLQKHFGPVTALANVSLALPPGSTTVIQGPSGSGKTTLLRLIAGLELPTAGEIDIGGQAASRPDWMRAPNQRGLGFVFQNASLWPHLTVAQNISFGLLGRPGSEVRARTGEMLAVMELTGLGKRYPSQLSGGQARRVSLARTLVTHPRRLLLDEPLTHIDPALKERLLTLINEMVTKQGGTLVYVTHSSEEAHYLPGRVLTMRDGRLQAAGE